MKRKKSCFAKKGLSDKRKRKSCLNCIKRKIIAGIESVV